MGYFSNSTDGEAYYSAFCARCIHEQQYLKDATGGGCAVWMAHLLANYKDCNNKESPLHVLIPRDEKTGANLQCRMFIPAPSIGLPLEGGG